MTTGFQATFDAIERLVSRVIAGEAVFFVGAGFSIDSEPNTSVRLIRRLLTRFAAITEHLETKRDSVAPQLREGLRITFQLGNKPLSSAAMIADETVNQLKPVYYNINDWICSAFTILLRELKGADDSALAGIRAHEKQLLETKINDKPYDEIPLEDFNIPQLLELEGQSGKALFLETMGFPNSQIWHGDPCIADARKVIGEYGGRLRERQFVIARLAREGIAPLILTSNFDLLLEGACRAIGFETAFGFAKDDFPETDQAKPSAAYDRLFVIAGPTDFFERGNAYRAAMLLKIHGCVYRYRNERKTSETLARYLPSMVFTYREIQNWRKDSWSRDLVSTLLRTRSIILCGYSGADAVIHDTFRTVYEEIQAHRGPRSAAGDQAAPQKDTRAFFTGAAGGGEFAGLEILRAGSRAAGVVDPKLFDHPNYLGFHFDTQQGFPTLDELFVWIYHRSLRSLQLNAIGSDLCRIAVMLLQRNVAPADVEKIAEAFKKHCDRETEIARQWDGSEESRRQFQEVTAWTNQFHVALLREFALMEAETRNQRLSLRIQDYRSSAYYFALLDRPGWGAWGALVEMALRRMAGLEDGRDTGVFCATYPLVWVRSLPGNVTKTALVLRGPGSTRIARTEAPGFYRRIHEWQLMTWLKRESTFPGTPTAENIWEWSFLPAAELKGAPGIWFGESDERKSGSSPKGDGGAGSQPVRAAVETLR